MQRTFILTANLATIQGLVSLVLISISDDSGDARLISCIFFTSKGGTFLANEIHLMLSNFNVNLEKISEFSGDGAFVKK